jgi:hypothetical protein
MTNELKSYLSPIIHHINEVQRLLDVGEIDKAHFHAKEIKEGGHLLANKIFWMQRNSGEVKS